MPVMRTQGQIRPIPTTIRHDDAPGAERAAMDMQSRRRMSGKADNLMRETNMLPKYRR